MAKRGENIYKRKDGRWEARVIKGYDEYGKALYAYFYGRTYKEAKDKIFSPMLFIKGATNQISSATDDVLFFENILDIWLENKKIGLKQSSYTKYFNLINKHIKPALGRHTLTDITSATLNSYIVEKYKPSQNNTTHGLSEKTLKDIAAIIKSTLRFAKADGMLFDAANINISLPRDKPKEMRVLSKEEQAALERHLCYDMDTSKLGVLLCMYTGLRIGEICALKWGSIFLDKRTLIVSNTMQRIQTFDDASTKTRVLVTEPKSDCSYRTIPLPDCLMDKLEKFQQKNPNAYLLTGEVERYIEPRSYQNHFKAYVECSGIKDANFHSIRHTFATRCIELGFEIKSLSEILGHANVNITLNRYVHPSLELKRSNMNKLAYLH